MSLAAAPVVVAEDRAGRDRVHGPLLSHSLRLRRARATGSTRPPARTVYDGLGRGISFWVGLDDTPTTGEWSPTNTAGTDLVKVSENVYDTGSVGDSNLTQTTQFPTSEQLDAWLDGFATARKLADVGIAPVE